MSYDEALADIAALRFDDAEGKLRALLADAPDNPAIHYELARVYAATGRAREALPHGQRVADLIPDNPRHRVNLGILHLRLGEYARGWELIGERIGLPEFHAEMLPLPLWRGEALAGKTILVWREQGFGDQIMAARFFALLKAEGARVIAAASARLTPLYRQLGVDTVELPIGFDPTKHPVRLPKADFYTHPLSIPRWLRIGPDNLPAEPYLAGKAVRMGDYHIGMAWRGNPTHPHEAHRSLPLEVAKSLGGGLKAMNLEPEATEAQDFQRTADIIAGLDLVVSVDTAIAHLAGAMGKPTILMLPAVHVDWRWALGEDRSPWYPSMRIVRQPAIGDWGSVVDEVRRLAPTLLPLRA